MHPLLDRFEAIVAQRATHPAVRDQHVTLDYRTLHAVAGGLAQRIAAETSQPRVGIFAPASSACAAAIFASWYAGKTPVPLNFLLGREELGKVIADAGIDTIISIDHLADAVHAAGLKHIPLNRTTLTPGRRPAPAATDRDLAVVVYTSGTSGVPKGVCLSFDNVLRNIDTCVQAAEITPDQVFLSLLPQFHTFGFTTNTLVPLLIGSTVTYLPRFSPTAVVNTIAEQKVSIFIAIASMFGAIAAMKSVTREQLASLDLPVSGGEPLPKLVAQTWERRFGKRILEGYGMTEASPVISLNVPAAYHFGSVGKAIPGVSVVAVDEDDHELPADTDGELVVRGHCVMQGYLNQPEQTAQTLRNGTLHTGDIGHLNNEGFIFITGRAKEMMIVGGENVFPHEIESILVQHPSLNEAAVIGVPDDLRGEVPVAFVLLRSDAPQTTEPELRAYCREALASYKVPRRIYISEDLPRGPTGKILKRALEIPKENGGQ